MREGLGCFGTIIVIMILGSLISGLNRCMNDLSPNNPFNGPIPKRFQGAYNSIGCGSMSNMAGLVTIGGKDISYGGAIFQAKELVRQSESAITVRGIPTSARGPEDTANFTITYAPLGGTARLDGAEYERCSEY